MRLLIVRLPDGGQHNVSLSLVPGSDAAELVESVEDAVALLRLRTFDAVILLGGRRAPEAQATLRRLRERAPLLAVVLLGLAAPRPRQADSAEAPRPTIVVDPAPGRLLVGGQLVALSQAEFRLFQLLWTRRGETVTAEQLMGAIYPDGARPSSRVLPVFLFKLRRKLAQVGLDNLVRTAIGRGFIIPATAATAATPAAPAETR